MKVLVVDDDASVRELAVTALRSEGYTVLTARDGEEALSRARAEQPNLIVLDLMLPPIDGLAVCRALRSESDVPIMMLTAGQAVDTTVGLDAGADEYLAKPVEPGEMVARVNAILRRGSRAGRVSSPLTVGGLTVDRLRREVRTGERVIELRAKEFDLLVAFIAHFGQALSRAQILHEVWDFDVPGKTRTVDVHVNHLRPRLAGTGVTIETLRGVGYRLVLSEP